MEEWFSVCLQGGASWQSDGEYILRMISLVGTTAVWTYNSGLSAAPAGTTVGQLIALNSSALTTSSQQHEVNLRIRKNDLIFEIGGSGTAILFFAQIPPLSD